MPTSVGYQDLASLLAHHRDTMPSLHLIASPFGTIETAPFQHTRLIAAVLSEPVGFQNVNFDPRSLDAFAWKVDEPLNARHTRQIEYPSVNRAHKGDRLPPRPLTPAAADPANLPQLAPADAPPSPASPVPPKALQDATAPSQLMPPSAAATPVATVPATAGAPLVVQRDVHDDVSVAEAPAEDRPDDLLAGVRGADTTTDDGATGAPLDELSFLGDGDSRDRSAAVYFGGGVMGAPEGLQGWAPGAAPILISPSEDSGIKLSALEGADYSGDQSGETVAGKDDSSRMESPAQRLGLAGEPLAHAEKCLADAVYFEARGEPLKGQEAVAQVVMNRVFSGYYPHNVCGVVFQNASHRFACQFTFACEGKDLSRIDEPDMWQQAKDIAKNMLAGKIWLADIGHATHYHAYWVHPSWVHEMVRLYKLGVHTFYRPRAWGDDELTWSPAAVKADADDKQPAGAADASSATPVKANAPAATPRPAAPIAATPIPPAPASAAPQAAVTPANAGASGDATAKL